jgi:hypothetical protein
MVPMTDFLTGVLSALVIYFWLNLLSKNKGEENQPLTRYWQ